MWNEAFGGLCLDTHAVNVSQVTQDLDRPFDEGFVSAGKLNLQCGHIIACMYL